MPRITVLNAIEIFKNSIQSPSTLEQYIKRLAEFHSFTKIKDYDSYLKMNSKENEMLIMEYIAFLKSKVEKGIISPNGIHIRISPIELFMAQNDIILNIKKIRKTFPRKVKKKGELPYTLEDIQALMENTKTHRDRAIVTFFASTGARPGALPDLKMQNLKDMDQGCMTVTIYENDPEEYPAFLTQEATKCLRSYFAEREFHGEKLNDSSPVFRDRYRRKLAWKNVNPITYGALKSSMYDIIRRAGIRKTLPDSNLRHDKALLGGFRKFFETTLNNINEVNANVTEKLMGHSKDLRGTYYNPDIQVRFDNFKLAIPSLTISDKYRDSLKIQKLESEAQQINRLGAKIQDQSRDIEWLLKTDRLRTEIHNESPIKKKQA